MKQGKPHVSAIWRLTCPQCNTTRLQKPGSWFEFKEGCERCNYRFEREEGYFWGAAWIVTYTVVGLVTLALAGWLLYRFPELDALIIATAVSVVGVLLSILAFPFGRTAWMVFDQAVHPLADKDRLKTDPED